MNKRPPDPLFVLRAHQTDVTALCFVSDVICKSIKMTAPALISGTKTGEIFIWNLKIYRVKFKLHGHNQTSLTFLGCFEKYIVSQGKADFINIWEYKENEDDWTIIRKIPSPDYGFCPVSLCYLNLKNYFIIPGQETGSFKIMDFASESVIKEISSISHGLCMCIKICLWKDEMFAVCGYESGTIVTWNIDKGVICYFTCHKDPVFCLDTDLQYKMQGVSGSADCILKTWHIKEDFQLSSAKEVTLNSGINCTAIRPDGKIVIVGCWNGDICVFSWKTLKPLAILNFHKSSVTCLQFHKTALGKYDSVFASGSKDFNIAIWTIY